MGMTVARMHKLLGELIDAGHGRKPLCVNKSSFKHPLEDEGAIILHVHAVVGPKWIAAADDDGGTKQNRDGTEAGRMTVIIDGGANE